MEEYDPTIEDGWRKQRQYHDETFLIQSLEVPSDDVCLKKKKWLLIDPEVEYL